MLKQRQIVEFNSGVIINLINGDSDIIKKMTLAPRIIPQNSQMKRKTLMKELLSMNSSLKNELQAIDKDIDLIA